MNSRVPVERKGQLQGLTNSKSMLLSPYIQLYSGSCGDCNGSAAIEVLSVALAGESVIEPSYEDKLEVEVLSSKGVSL